MNSKNLVSILVSTIVMFVLSILSYSLIEYYDLQSIMILGIPFLLIIRFADLNIRDYITRERNMQILVSTFITTVLVVLVLVGAYFIYTSVLHNADIYKMVIEALHIQPLMQYVN